MADGHEQEKCQANQKGKASEGLGCFDLCPDQFKSEASAFGIADLFLNGHTAIIKGQQVVRLIVNHLKKRGELKEPQRRVVSAKRKSRRP